MDVTIAIVAYNALDKLRACLDSLAAQQDVEAEVILVDNASAEPVSETVQRDYPWVRLIASPANLGFAKGTNLAVAAGTAPWVLLLNPDTELPELDTLRRLLDLASRAKVDVIGCRMLLSDGSPQLVPTLRPRAGVEVLDLVHRKPPQPEAFAHGAEAVDEDGLLDVDFVSGASLFTTRAIWEEVGELDTGYFMYLEDADWCRRAQAHGYFMAYAMRITIRHYEGSSYGGKAFLRREHYWRSLVRYVRLHDPWWDSLLLRAMLAFTSFAKLPFAALKHDEDRAGRLHLLRSQLRLGLRGD